ncbi:MAG TPA: serine hydrolase domain-containing protein [Thermoanaerobaculia bacterium]|nr:serine hydrolase domain-containing protein [Thermoanaerobaculia bacterium]
MSQRDLGERLQARLEALVRRNGDVPHAVLGVKASADRFTWSGAAGVTRKNGGEVMTTATPFFVASVTKTFTAVATLQLEERGRLALEDPLDRHLPAAVLDSLHRFRGRDRTGELTVAHLLSHTSGLPDYFQQRPPGGHSVFDRILAGEDPQWDAEEAVRIAKELSPRFAPQPLRGQEAGRLKAFYSDTNYQILGRVLESATGLPLHEVYQELIFSPLGLADTYLHGHGGDRRKPPATIHHRRLPLQLDRAMRSFWADGGIVSTLADQLRFVEALFEAGLFQRADTLHRMQRWNRIFFPFRYGYGLMRLEVPGLPWPFPRAPVLIGHSGSSGSFLYRSERTGIYVAGTVDQIASPSRPIRYVLGVIRQVEQALAGNRPSLLRT